MCDLSNMELPKVLFLDHILFIIYISDPPLFINSCCELFADDTTIHSSNSNLKKLSKSLQESVNSLLEWAEFNHMSLHIDKTKCMLITTRQKRQKFNFDMPIYFHRKLNVYEIDSCKVLGVTIDCNLSWSSCLTALY